MSIPSGRYFSRSRLKYGAIATASCAVVLCGDEVQRLAHQGRAHNGPVVQRAAQIVPLEALEPRRERDVRRAGPLALERAEPVDRRRHVERDAFEQQLPRERGAVQRAQSSGFTARTVQRAHGADWRSCSRCSYPPVRPRATALCSPRRSAICPPRSPSTRTAPTVRRPATTRGAISSRPCWPPDRSARRDGRCAPICSRAAGRRSHAPKRSTAATASAAPRRSHRFRDRTGLRLAAPGRRRSPAGWPPRPRGANGAVGIWVHELGSGRYAGFRADTRFAAASTVKLGALAAALRRRRDRSGAVVVRRPPDRLLVVEPRREPDLGRPRLRCDHRRAAPARA